MQTAFLPTCDAPVARLRVIGDLDLSTSGHFREVIECLRLSGCTRIELDLAAVSFIDACGLGVLDAEQRRSFAAGGVVEVVAASDCYQRVARLARYYALLAPASEPDTMSQAR